MEDEPQSKPEGAAKPTGLADRLKQLGEQKRTERDAEEALKRKVSADNARPEAGGAWSQAISERASRSNEIDRRLAAAETEHQQVLGKLERFDQLVTALTKAEDALRTSATNLEKVRMDFLEQYKDVPDVVTLPELATIDALADSSLADGSDEVAPYRQAKEQRSDIIAAMKTELAEWRNWEEGPKVDTEDDTVAAHQVQEHLRRGLELLAQRRDELQKQTTELYGQTEQGREQHARERLVLQRHDRSAGPLTLATIEDASKRLFTPEDLASISTNPDELQDINTSVLAPEQAKELLAGHLRAELKRWFDEQREQARGKARPELFQAMAAFQTQRSELTAVEREVGAQYEAARQSTKQWLEQQSPEDLSELAKKYRIDLVNRYAEPDRSQVPAQYPRKVPGALAYEIAPKLLEDLLTDTDAWHKQIPATHEQLRAHTKDSEKISDQIESVRRSSDTRYRENDRFQNVPDLEFLMDVGRGLQGMYQRIPALLSETTPKDLIWENYTVKDRLLPHYGEERKRWRGRDYKSPLAGVSTAELIQARLGLEKREAELGKLEQLASELLDQKLAAELKQLDVELFERNHPEALEVLEKERALSKESLRASEARIALRKADEVVGMIGVGNKSALEIPITLRPATAEQPASMNFAGELAKLDELIRRLDEEIQTLKTEQQKTDVTIAQLKKAWFSGTKLEKETERAKNLEAQRVAKQSERIEAQNQKQELKSITDLVNKALTRISPAAPLATSAKNLEELLGPTMENLDLYEDQLELSPEDKALRDTYNSTKAESASAQAKYTQKLEQYTKEKLNITTAR